MTPQNETCCTARTRHAGSPRQLIRKGVASPRLPGYQATLEGSFTRSSKAAPSRYRFNAQHRAAEINANRRLATAPWGPWRSNLDEPGSVPSGNTESWQTRSVELVSRGTGRQPCRTERVPSRGGPGERFNQCCQPAAQLGQVSLISFENLPPCLDGIFREPIPGRGRRG